MSASSASEYSDIEERANAITHGLGVVLGVVGLILLLIRAFDYQADMLTVASMAVYGSSIILLFLASTLYHSITTEKTKRLLKTLDHCAIYLLIAGSYTPFLLVGLRTPLAMGLMAVIWGIALVGIIMKIAFRIPIQALIVIHLLSDGLAIFDCCLSISDEHRYRWFGVTGGWRGDLLAGCDFLCGKTHPL